MYGLNAVAPVFFGCINVMAYQLCKWRPTAGITEKRIFRTLTAGIIP